LKSQKVKLWYKVSKLETLECQRVVWESDIYTFAYCSCAVRDPRVGHTMDVLSPFTSVLCHSDWLYHGESCPRIDAVHPGSAWSSSPACTWHFPCITSFLRNASKIESIQLLFRTVVDVAIAWSIVAKFAAMTHITLVNSGCSSFTVLINCM